MGSRVIGWKSQLEKGAMDRIHGTQVRMGEMRGAY
jgi:hypothetical protein